LFTFFRSLLVTVGDHLRKRRADLGLTRAGAAAKIGVGAWSYGQWEHGLQNELMYFPAIIAFLGYIPLPQGTTFGESVRRERIARGLTRRRLAEMAGVTEGSIQRVEADNDHTLRQTRRRVSAALQLLSRIR
jgi:transcriptional regulator with XRE-family HTH domain